MMSLFLSALKITVKAATVMLMNVFATKTGFMILRITNKSFISQFLFQ